jgi:hypothetical protein
MPGGGFMSSCACGCGEETKGGKFLQGHEQKLRKRLDEKVGGLPLLARLVQAGEMYAGAQMTLDDLGRVVKLIFSKE